MPIFLGLATILAILQNVLGVTIAKLLGENPLLGIICGGLIGGPIAARLIRQKQLLPHRENAAREIEALHEEAEIIESTQHEPGIIASLRAMRGLAPRCYGMACS